MSKKLKHKKAQGASEWMQFLAITQQEESTVRKRVVLSLSYAAYLLHEESGLFATHSLDLIAPKDLLPDIDGIEATISSTLRLYEEWKQSQPHFMGMILQKSFKDCDLALKHYLVEGALFLGVEPVADTLKAPKEILEPLSRGQVTAEGFLGGLLLAQIDHFSNG